MIRTQLAILLKNDLPAMTKDNCIFYYDAFDLNKDSKNEYFVGFSNSYFCGAGGCSGYILNNDGSLINSFSVMDFPVFVATTTSGNFRDHIVKSNGKFPSNPSVQEVFKGKIPNDSPALLDIYEGKYEKCSF